MFIVVFLVQCKSKSCQFQVSERQKSPPKIAYSGGGSRQLVVENCNMRRMIVVGGGGAAVGNRRQWWLIATGGIGFGKKELGIWYGRCMIRVVIINKSDGE